MFNRLIAQFDSHNRQGVIWSVQGGYYIAQHISQKNDVIKQAPNSFRSLQLAKNWLRKQGVCRVSLQQTPAYFEMIGLTCGR